MAVPSEDIDVRVCDSVGFDDPAHARLSYLRCDAHELAGPAGGDDDFGAVGAEPTMAAKHPRTACGQRFASGAPIASMLVDKKWQRHLGRHLRVARLPSNEPR